MSNYFDIKYSKPSNGYFTLLEFFSLCDHDMNTKEISPMIKPNLLHYDN